jgi:hypothetical protein
VTTGGTLPAGTYAVSGTDVDTSSNTGTWGFTLTVTIAQVSAFNRRGDNDDVGRFHQPTGDNR